MSNPVDPLRELGKRMRALASELGCDMQKFAIAPDLDGDADLVQVVFILPELDPEPDEDAMVAELLASIEEHETKSLDEAIAERAREVKRKLKDS